MRRFRDYYRQFEEMPPEGQPTARRPHAAAAPLEQHRGELALQALDVLGDRGLGERQVLGRPRDAAHAGDLQEAPDLRHFHAITIPYGGIQNINFPDVPLPGTVRTETDGWRFMHPLPRERGLR